MTYKVLIDGFIFSQQRIAVVDNSGSLCHFDIENNEKDLVSENIYAAQVLNREASMGAFFLTMNYCKETDTEIRGFLANEDLSSITFTKGNHNGSIVEQDGKKLLLKRGQLILVQALNDGRKNKRAAVTTHITIDGQFCSYLPNTDEIDPLNQINCDENSKEAKAICELLRSIPKPIGASLILRDKGSLNVSHQLIEKDCENIMQEWLKILDRLQKVNGPGLIFSIGNTLRRILHKLPANQITSIVVEGDASFQWIKENIKTIYPVQFDAQIIKHVKQNPIFHDHGIESAIDTLCFSNLVALNSGGYLIIETSEAFTSIDINSGSASVKTEDAAFILNKEAAIESIKQIKLQNIRGTIVIDFVDMKKKSYKKEIDEVFDRYFSSDFRTKIGKLNEFCTLTITRKRAGSSLSSKCRTQCAVCDGSGLVPSVRMATLRMLRALRNGLSSNEKNNKFSLATSKEILIFALNNFADVWHTFDSSGIEFSIRPDFAPHKFVITSEVIEEDKATEVAAIKEIFAIKTHKENTMCIEDLLSLAHSSLGECFFGHFHL